MKATTLRNIFNQKWNDAVRIFHKITEQVDRFKDPNAPFRAIDRHYEFHDMVAEEGEADDFLGAYALTRNEETHLENSLRYLSDQIKNFGILR